MPRARHKLFGDLSAEADPDLDAVAVIREAARDAGVLDERVRPDHVHHLWAIEVDPAAHTTADNARNAVRHLMDIHQRETADEPRRPPVYLIETPHPECPLPGYENKRRMLFVSYRKV